jgi:hypothetical protein
VKEPKRICRCGCGKYVSARTELRHRNGKAPTRIQAAQDRGRAALRLAKSLTKSVTSKAGQALKSTLTNISDCASHVSSSISGTEESRSHDDNQTEDFFAGDENLLHNNSIASRIEGESTSAMNVDLMHDSESAVGPVPAVLDAQNAARDNWQHRRATVTDVLDEEEGGQDEGDEDDSGDGLSDLDVPVIEGSDTSSIEDVIDAEWEKEWAQLGTL